MIFFLSLTKIYGAVSFQSLAIPGYTLNRFDRNLSGGGVLTYFKSYFSYFLLSGIQFQYNTLGSEFTLH